jgi:type I restriction enzyme R subunit
LIDDFSEKNKPPQIAVSVDMLDTGVDIPEILNLVFFKKVRSKTKFWQMIGRGTRLCEDIYGVGIHKDGFRIFDYCGNFEFFRTNKNGKEAKMIKSLTENLFNIRVWIIKELQNLDYQLDEYITHRQKLIDGVLKEVQTIDESKFNARMKLQFIHKFNQSSAFECLTDTDVRELEENIAPLIPAIDDDELAKRFDYLMYTIEYADLKKVPASKSKNRVVSTAERLSYKGSIEKVKRQEELIYKVQTNEHWEEADIFDHEEVREAFRDLIKFLDSQSGEIYYTNFTDEIMEIKENPGEYSVNDMQSYRKKVNKYLAEHQNDLAIYKLRNNKPLTKEDIKCLEKVLWQDLGTKEDYMKEFGDEPLLKLVSKIVGLDPQAANEVFSEFLSDESLNINQMEFVKLVVNYIIKNGSLDKRVLNEHPFNKRGNVMHLFDGKLDIAKRIIGVIDKINGRLSV